MTIDEEKYYEAYFDLFNSKGWKQLITELEEIYQSYSVDRLNSNEELHLAKGERQVLARLLNFENGVEAAYASVKDGNSISDEVVGYDTEEPDY